MLPFASPLALLLALIFAAGIAVGAAWSAWRTRTVVFAYDDEGPR